ncbi:hypothetical protein VNO80_06657 [Phaseolus coccineus]|uniref:Uncharacterized protein n=1 Tax=Phaseolus coccineus TaxID=3886 RepID=A0AAN9NI52_PHACN
MWHRLHSLPRLQSPAPPPAVDLLLLHHGFVLVCESAYNKVVGGGDFEEVSILEMLEAAFIFGGKLRELGEWDLVTHVPFRLDIHRDLKIATSRHNTLGFEWFMWYNLSRHMHSFSCSCFRA